MAKGWYIDTLPVPRTSMSRDCIQTQNMYLRQLFQLSLTQCQDTFDTIPCQAHVATILREFRALTVLSAVNCSVGDNTLT